MIHHFPFLLVRTPLQSLEKAYDFTGKMEPVMEEGIYLSSSEFWAGFKNREKLNGKDREKLELSFTKYWIRSCMRSTPYGTFAGCAIGEISDVDRTEIVLNDCNNHIRRLRLDTNYVTEIIQALVKTPLIREQVKLYTNNTIYELPSSFRYVEYSIRNNTRFYDLNSVEKTDYLKTVFDRARNGATICELIEVLNVTEAGEQEEARTFIESLQEAQLLISGMEPSLTGPEPIDQLIGALENLNGVDELLDRLLRIKKEIESPDEGVGRYQQIEEELKKIGVELVIPKNTLQTDLFLSLQKNHISLELVGTITRQCEDLLSLSVQINNPELTSFKERFYARYEEMEVPLAFALDSELGIGYTGNRDGVVSGDFIDDLPFGGKSMSELLEVNFIQRYVISKYHDWLENKKSCIEITADELKGFSKQVADFQFPVSMYLMGSLLKINDRLNETDFLFDLETFSGPSAANLLGRFSHGSEQLCAFTREILKTEERQRPDCLFAEIVHLPQARTGNILLRPVLRDYEIPYVGVSGAPREYQIPTGDLMVSIRDGAVILRSKIHNKRVIPRLTTAHNFAKHGLPIYKFLCDLQSQGMARPNHWDWGQLVLLKRLPRVIYKNIIIAKARWRIEERDVRGLPGKEDRIEYFRKFRRELEMANPVCYNEDGNKLLIDFEQEKGIELFLHYLHRYKNILLEEFLFTEDHCVVRDVQGSPFTNELIIPVYREVPVIRDYLEKQLAVGSHAVKRKFSPLSEWLYFKIYAGQKTAEKLLKTCIAEFVENNPGKTPFEKFFFIRYRDDSSHLRIRFYNPDVSRQAFLQKLFLETLQPFLDNGTINKIVLDTYNRELERYGADLIQESESLFYNDSLAVLRFIRLLDGEEEERYRILFALRGIDMLLNDFTFSISDKQVLAKRIQGAYFNEFGSEPALQKQLNEKYRKYQKDIFSHMLPERDILNEISEAVSIFNTRSEMNRPVIDSIFSKLPAQSRSARITGLLPGLIHMNMNRLFLGNQRKYELVVYHFLERYYSSQEAILKRKS